MLIYIRVPVSSYYNIQFSDFTEVMKALEVHPRHRLLANDSNVSTLDTEYIDVSMLQNKIAVTKSAATTGLTLFVLQYTLALLKLG